MHKINHESSPWVSNERWGWFAGEMLWVHIPHCIPEGFRDALAYPACVGRDSPTSWREQPRYPGLLEKDAQLSCRFPAEETQEFFLTQTGHGCQHSTWLHLLSPQDYG